ncbi:L-serine ammonia-lyase, iron-sulfur-dependent, subunit alpha [uncultured Desulfosarcina sp.]|uniref:L-cysteine desulfidase family protein n=1 Tax=uncultured Desulfosarcina sp. TaxID=218289 RepID=UPI0029C8191C|nr:L-serine ammonia-lyase, iron-sulfur-dependent, subunit alpha [uncultured Desulfosarcina sp.]
MEFRVKDILKIQVAPALGCTEPVAIALGSAAAVSLLPEKRIDAIEIWVDPNIYKNGLAVSIPGTDGLSGLDMASALGAMGGDPKLRLEVLDSVDEAAVTAAIEMVKAGRVKVNLLRDQVGLYIRTVINGGGHTAESVITGLHDNVVSLVLDGQAIEKSDLLPHAAGKNGTSRLAELEAWLKDLTLDQLIQLLDDLDDEDRKFLQAGIDVNLRLADYGLKHGPGLGVGRTMERLVRQGLIKRDMLVAARILASSAADARMSGVKLPAMSSAGSGNHGLTAILPIVAVEEFLSVDHALVIEAIGLSHIITAYVKAYTGRLSAICGCSVAAGAGATAGITYLMGGTKQHIAGAIKNLTEDLAGVICDGAKGGCALKLATAAGTAVQAALFSLQGVNVSFTDGIIGRSSEDTMKNIGTLTTQGMIETDRTILNIMLEKQFSNV